jgi:hypothetical protein
MAGELAIGLGYVGEQSDNINRAPAGSELSDRTHSYVAGLAYRESGGVLAANVQLQAEQRDYVKNVYDDGPLYYANVSALLTPIPQRFSWMLADRYDYGLRELGAPYTPANRTAANVFETGPDLSIGLGTRNSLGFGARYGSVYYSDTNTDHDRYGFSARWRYEVNPTLDWSLNYESLKVDYNQDIDNVDVLTQSVFLRRQDRAGRSLFAFDVGHMRVSRDLGGSVDGPLARVRWTVELTSESSFNLLAGAEYSDAGTVLLSSTSGPGGAPGTEPVTQLVTSDIFYSRRLEAGYVRNGSAVGFNITAFGRDLDYQITDNDHQVGGGGLGITLNPQGTFTSSGLGTAAHTRYKNGTGREDAYYETTLRFLYRANRQVDLILDGIRTWQNSNGLGGGTEFDEQRIRLSLFYRTSPLYTPAPRR